MHEAEAHQRIDDLTAAETKRKAAQKAEEKRQREAKEEAARLAAEDQKQKSRMAALAAAEERLRRDDPFYDLMLPIKGGTFDMGSNEQDAAKPIHKVTVSDFHLCKYPVTQGQWKQIMGKNPGHFTGDDNLPVEQVSWHDAQEFIKALNKKTGKTYRLPSEAEWEYAAKGGNQSKDFKYAGSNDLKEVSWYHKNSGSKTHPVGQKKPNDLGLYDMSGNVWEWCEDTWHPNYEGAPADGSAWTKGDSSGRVVRGGSWSHGDSDCGVVLRGSGMAGLRGSDIGFRLAQD